MINMNNSVILRLMKKSRNIYIHKEQFNRVLRQYGSRNMSTNASINQIDKEKVTFQDAWPGIMNSLLSSPKFSEIHEVRSWVAKMLDYNLAGGKKIRGITTVLAYELLEKPENITEETLKLARVAGWCTELLQAYLLMVDDIMDGSVTRRGVPCWYRRPDVGLGAINDSIFVYSSLMELLKTYFGQTEYYTAIIELFNEGLLVTCMGQHLDYATAHRNKKDYSQFTVERYSSIVEYKTSYYTFKLPVFLGLLLNKTVNKTALKNIENICFEFGNLFQIQDDFMDCFGDGSVTGKVGTDIQEGKCSWLAVQAIQRCSVSQRTIFQQFYGEKDPEHVDRIKRLYEELNLPQLYKQQEGELYNNILGQIGSLPADISPVIFHKILDVIYKRNY